MVNDFFNFVRPNFLEMKKSIFLIFTLAIPATVFLFLKYFGNNTFEVPVLFESGIPNCADSFSLHRVPNLEYIGETEKQLTPGRQSEFRVYGVLETSDEEQLNETIVELIRIQDAFFETRSPNFILFIKGDQVRRNDLELLCSNAGLNHENASYFYPEEQSLYKFLKCGIALVQNDSDSLTKFVLVDTEKRIRGIYNYSDEKETDRLILELKILKKQSK